MTHYSEQEMRDIVERRVEYIYRTSRVECVVWFAIGVFSGIVMGRWL